MANQSGVTISSDTPVLDTMKAWVVSEPDQLKLAEKAVPMPGQLRRTHCKRLSPRFVLRLPNTR